MSSLPAKPVQGEASMSQEQRPVQEFQQIELVTNPENDVATNEYLDRMLVGVLGRRQFQKTPLRSPRRKGLAILLVIILPGSRK